MAAITLAEICDAVKTTLSAAASLKRSESYDELTEGIHDCPLLQVYWEEIASVDRDKTTDRTSFTGRHRQKPIIIHADVYVNERSNLAEDMARTITAVDQIIDILEAQDALDANASPLFGLVATGAVKGAIRSFTWTARRVSFEYGGVLYAGTRFVLDINLF